MASSFDDIGLDERSWNALASLGTNSVFQTYEWHRSWWSTYGALYEPLFVTVSDGSSTCGVAPLMIEQTIAGRVIRFVGGSRADYCDLLAGNDWNTVSAIVKGLKDYGNWDVLDMTNIPSQSTTVEMITALCRDAGLGVIVQDQFVCPTLLLSGHEINAHRILRKPSLRRRINYFERIGHLGFRDLTEAADVEPCLDMFFRQHIARWSGHSTPSLFHDPVNQTFYREMTQRMSGTGWMVFSQVQLDGQPIAMHYGFDYNGTVIWYKPSFDPAFASGSPGLVLVRHLIARAVERGRREFDFTIGDESFKRRFTNHVRKTVRVQVFRDSSRFMYERVKHGLTAAVRRAAASLRQG